VKSLFHQVMLAYVQPTTVWKVTEGLIVLFLFVWAAGRHCSYLVTVTG